jgi:hypothetical protein
VFNLTLYGRVRLRVRPIGMNNSRLLSVLVAVRRRAERQVREWKMRQFGELEAVIMDQLWEWGRPPPAWSGSASRPWGPSRST